MDKGIFATVEHRKLMELKNCGAVDALRLDDFARLMFLDLKKQIKEIRKASDNRGFLSRLISSSMPIESEVDLMFTDREELVKHLSAVDVPSELCPIPGDVKERFLFIDRAARYAEEAQKVLDMFKRHHEVIVDSDRSLVIDWILQNHNRIRLELNKGV